MSQPGSTSQPKLPPRSLGKRIAFRCALLALLAAATIAPILLLEFIASFFVTVPARSFADDVRLNHSWPKNSSHTHDEWAPDNPNFPEPYVHTYNSQGWVESYDIAREKPPGTYRIFYVGDSFTEGCVPMDESIASQVERHLNASGRPEKFEVINTGTSSYSPVIYYVLIRYYLAEYDPDLIVINVDMTDCFDDWKYRETLIVDEEGNPLAVPSRNLFDSAYVDTALGAVKGDFTSRTRLFLTRYSHLYNWMARGSSKPPPAPEDADDIVQPRWAWCEYEWDEQTEEQVAFTLDILTRIAEFCRSEGIQLAWTGVPHYQQFAHTPGEPPEWSDRPHRELLELAEEQGVIGFDSLTPLAAEIAGSEQTDFYYRENMHFNPRGNRLWGGVHVGVVEELLHVTPVER